MAVAAVGAVTILIAASVAMCAARLASCRQRCTRARSISLAPRATLAATLSLSMVTS